MKSPIILKTRDAFRYSGRPDRLLGCTDVECTTYNFPKQKPLQIWTAKLPEFGPLRFYGGNVRIREQGVVVQMGTARYRIRYHAEYQNDVPTSGVAEFIPTSDAETPFTPGNNSSRRPYLSMFGQPCFIQNPVWPEYQGRCAYHLLTIEDGWGDAGNINVMVALNDQDRPVRVFQEYSCA